MPDYFDVCKLPPGTPDCIATRCINLMCALLKGISYRDLYDTPFYQQGGKCTLDTMIDNINALPPALQRGATTNDPIVIPLLAGRAGAFVKIHQELSKPGAPEILLKNLYTEGRQDPPQDPLHQLYNFIVDTFEAVHATENDQMYHFCVPFLSIQLGRRTTRPSASQFERFLAVLGDKNLQDFYDAPYTKDEQREAVAARQSGILREIRPKGSRPPVIRAEVHDGNGRHCVDGECCDSDNEDDWCNTITVNGQPACALGSDIGQICY